jgi:predicted glycosyltransferase involved in capsule biosynthesis
MLTIVLPYKDRDEQRLNNCLYTLFHQTVQSKVLLVDYGSSPEFQKIAKKVTAEYAFSYFYIPIENWKKTHANNIGLRKVSTNYVLFSDVDMIYKPNFIETVLKMLERERAIVTCKCFYLSKNETRGLRMPIDWKTYKPVIDQTSGETAVGACLGVETDWIKNIGGFDEKFSGWGREDVDVLIRAKLSKLVQIGIEERTGFYHQWHLVSDWKKNKEAITSNAQYFDEMTIKKQMIFRNQEGWGLL